MLLVEDTSSFGKAVIRGLLVLVCLLLRHELTVLSMWSESMSGSCMVTILLLTHKAVNNTAFVYLCDLRRRKDKS